MNLYLKKFSRKLFSEIRSKKLGQVCKKYFMAHCLYQTCFFTSTRSNYRDLVRLKNFKNFFKRSSKDFLKAKII